MDLRRLEASFIGLMEIGERDYAFNNGPMKEAQGVSFLCPKCYVKNGGPIETHRVVLWFFGKVGEDVKPLPHWRPLGSDINDLSILGTDGFDVIEQKHGCKKPIVVKAGDAT